MFERKSLKWPILLAIVMIVMLVGLTIGWILITIFGANWILLSVGSIMFVFVLLGVVLYLVWSIQQINLNRRQSNFIDAVTHELKSPITSLKLFLQTLGKRNIDEAQRQEFYHSMLDDVDRLDQLITQLLDVARLQQDSNEPEPESWVAIESTLEEFTNKLVSQHHISRDCVSIECPPCEVWARRVDIDILVRNLIDNALKYAGKPPVVEIKVRVDNQSGNTTILVSDNGIGIPRHLHRKIFRRFYRVGNELERTKPGTGLGLFLVRSIVRRIRGSIRVVDLPKNSGSRFELVLPQSRLRSVPGQPLDEVPTTTR
ncbi:MAG: HAMP domain-containing histidine kinase [Pirellula sp.]|jgi:two-component system phosphate regulon sensor histidine kinase PhoR|nr:HAMP domain-containing histidine kinase [Pirellula sp.]